MRRAAAALAVFLAGSAHADPTKQECAAANESAQDLQSAGKLLAARKQLAMCLAPACPAVVRQDCAQKLEDVTRGIPTIILAARQAGSDLSAVRVEMDGAPLVDHLDGKALQVDPGQHRFAFMAEGLVREEKSVIVRTGEKDRPIEVELRSASPVVTTKVDVVAPVVATPAPPEGRSLVAATVTSFTVGVVGAVVGGVMTALWAGAKSDGDNACGVPGSCDPGTANGWETKQTGYSAGLIAGFAVAAVGVALGVVFFVAGKPRARTMARGVLLTF